MHAAQNEMLPLRVVVQVLFFEQARASMAGGQVKNAIPNNIKVLLEGRSSPAKSSVSTLKMKLAEDDDVEINNSLDGRVVKSSKIGPRRMFSKLWPISRSASEKN